jgi:dihydrofolate reductase
MILSMIAALDEMGAIGWMGSLPWHLPDDLKRFRALTLGHHVIMGRKTYESIGKPLPGRSMLVVTHQVDFAAPGCSVVPSLQAGLSLAEQAGETELFVMGGGELYALALPLTQRLYLTRVKTRVQADVFFPRVNLEEWQILETQSHPADDRHAFAFCFETLQRFSGAVEKTWGS